MDNKQLEIRTILDKIENSEKLGYFYSRWCDERKYEDMKDYNDAIEKEFPIKLTKGITRKSFSFEFNNTYKQYKIKLVRCELQMTSNINPDLLTKDDRTKIRTTIENMIHEKKLKTQNEVGENSVVLAEQILKERFEKVGVKA